MPIIELDYTYYPFKMMLHSLTSLARVFPDDKLCDYREVFGPGSGSKPWLGPGFGGLGLLKS